MTKKILCTAIALVSVLALCTGCGSKPANTTVVEKSASDVKSEGNGYKNDNLDLKTIAQNVKDKYKNGDYGLNDITIEIPTEENKFFNIIIVSEEKPSDPGVYVDICRECLFDLNAEAIKQDPQYSPSSENYYGGLFDQYTVILTATCYDEILEKWPVYQTIDSGKHDPIVTNNDEIDLLDF